jgi:hypothetical protein
MNSKLIHEIVKWARENPDKQTNDVYSQSFGYPIQDLVLIRFSHSSGCGLKRKKIEVVSESKFALFEWICRKHKLGVVVWGHCGDDVGAKPWDDVVEEVIHANTEPLKFLWFVDQAESVIEVVDYSVIVDFREETEYHLVINENTTVVFGRDASPGAHQMLIPSPELKEVLSFPWQSLSMVKEGSKMTLFVK